MTAERIAAVRRFNRFYTRIVGALDEGHLQSRFALAEVRLLFEIAHGNGPTATALVADLGLDAGYVSRLLRELSRRRLVRSTRSPDDGRRWHLSLTAKGRATVLDLESRAGADVARLIEPLADDAQTRLVGAMETVRALLEPEGQTPTGEPFTLRAHQSGDMGWVVQTHGVLYAREYGWDERFEALVATIVAGFIESLDATREQCWIAERHGMRVGSVFLVRHPERDGVAKLRLLLVDPAARGLGLGQRLVRECTDFARASGYHTITLWTNDVLAAARRIYQAEGYRLVDEQPHHSYGHDLMGQTWELALVEN